MWKGNAKKKRVGKITKDISERHVNGIHQVTVRCGERNQASVGSGGQQEYRTRTSFVISQPSVRLLSLRAWTLRTFVPLSPPSHQTEGPQGHQLSQTLRPPCTSTSNLPTVPTSTPSCSLPSWKLKRQRGCPLFWVEKQLVESLPMCSSSSPKYCCCHPGSCFLYGSTIQ